MWVSVCVPQQETCTCLEGFKMSRAVKPIGFHWSCAQFCVLILVSPMLVNIISLQMQTLRTGFNVSTAFATVLWFCYCCMVFSCHSKTKDNQTIHL